MYFNIWYIFIYIKYIYEDFLSVCQIVMGSEIKIPIYINRFFKYFQNFLRKKKEQKIYPLLN
jgi:hypothetical protein